MPPTVAGERADGSDMPVPGGWRAPVPRGGHGGSHLVGGDGRGRLVAAERPLETVEGLLVRAAGRGGQARLGQKRCNSAAEGLAGPGEGDDSIRAACSHDPLLTRRGRECVFDGAYLAAATTSSRWVLGSTCGREWTVPCHNYDRPLAVTVVSGQPSRMSGASVFRRCGGSGCAGQGEVVGRVGAKPQPPVSRPAAPRPAAVQTSR
jgi:hypothetical protein